ncbi:hypothetical protein GCM10022419_111780 [Nonomuraea rosea]|uniref:Uncharacterized protein n=1 Tax=Nonomuraea rosea TaxID=638574 RepID=A0ABP6ZHX7_9ACTN
MARTCSAPPTPPTTASRTSAAAGSSPGWWAGSIAFRNKFIYHGHATIKIGTESMKGSLAQAKPPGIPLDPWA